ncbi:MAG: rubrerythrin family protein [Candidatus Moranbacteria bacterium]|nr:rubrerythrin family protein [Candidatus Moranbacteria bacterium]
MSKTQENLKAAFAGESQANRKYLAFAKVAEAEGKTNLAKLFRVVAEGETVHALKHLNNLGEVKDSVENVKAAIAGETYEVETMYPEFIAAAEEEGNGAAKVSFIGANEVEKIHQATFRKALEAVEAGNDIPEVQYHICSVCGELFEGEVPDNCPVCKAPKEKFYSI